MTRVIFILLTTWMVYVVHKSAYAEEAQGSDGYE